MTKEAMPVIAGGANYKLTFINTYMSGQAILTNTT